MPLTSGTRLNHYELVEAVGKVVWARSTGPATPPWDGMSQSRFSRKPSLMVQAVLLLPSAVPYVFVRYFVGGVDVWTELCWIAILLVASAVVTGTAMGFWATKLPTWVKWGVVLHLPWGLLVVADELHRQVRRGYGGLTTGEIVTFLVFGVVSPR